MILARNKLTISMVPEMIGMTRYYMLRDQALPRPIKPTTNPPQETAWVTTEPGYVEGSTNNLYTVDKLEFSDDSFQYSDVSLASAYTAAKQAYILAKDQEKHFFFDTSGAHITHGEHAPNTGKNVLITNEGMQIRNDTTTLAEFSDEKAQIGESSSNNVAMTNDSVAIRTGETETAKFTAEKMRMGLAEESRVEIEPTGTVFYGKGGGKVAAIKTGTSYSEIDIDPAGIHGGDNLFDISGNSAYYSSYVNNKTFKKQITHVPVTSQTYQHDYLVRVNVTLSDYNESIDVFDVLDFNDSGTRQVNGAQITVSFNKTDNTITVIFGVIPGSSDSSDIFTFRLSCNYVYLLAPSTYSFGENCESRGDNSFTSGEGVIATGNNSFAIGEYNLTTNSPFVIGNGTGENSRSDLLKIYDDGGHSALKFSGIIHNMIGQLITEEEVFTGYNLIPKNKDLNTVVARGSYESPTNAYTTTQSNAPFGNNEYTMLVFRSTENNNIVFQVAWNDNTATYIRYRIRNSGGTWGGWRSLATGSGDLGSYLTTSSASSTYLTKTAASSTYAQKSVVGTIVYKTLDSNTVIEAGSTPLKNMASISCAAGIWSVTAHAAFQPGGTVGHYRAVAIGSTATNSTYGLVQVGASSGSTSISTSRHVTLSSAATLYLNVYSQDKITVSASTTIIEAVRLR